MFYTFAIFCVKGVEYFLATSLVIEQKEMDEEVDIFQVVRRIQTRRPKLLPSVEIPK
jgi:hypothetical protein